MNTRRSNTFIRWLVGASLWAGILFSASAGDAPALVTQVQGAALRAQHQLGLLDPVQAGDIITLARGAQLVIFQPVRHQQLTLTGPAVFLVKDESVVHQSGSGSVRRDLQDPAFVGVVRSREQVIAGAVLRAAAGPLVAPVTERIAPSLPVLVWRAQAHTGEWQVRLLDHATEQEMFATSLAGTALTLPDSMHLLPGQRYRRELRWHRRDGSVQVDTAALEVLDAAVDAQLMRLLPPADAPLAARVLFALYLRHLGVHGLARQIAPEINDINPPL